MLKPMMYVIVRNGFTPRLSLEVSDSGQVRLEKITEIIKSCKYSIHDLSIVKTKKANEFARLNMPFELGIDYGLRKNGISPLDTKQFLVLEAKKYDYMKAMSDFNGFDIKVHGNDTEKLFECLYTWFSETLKINKQDPPLKLFYDFMDFNTSLFEEKAKEFGSEKLAMNYVKKVSIPEYIQEIQERL
ncbi:MAG: hypothetical protein ICV53_13180 [Flavisolibacter sp.]|nr:hypothetical protein [Flavisolibacter sp.]